MDEKKKYNYMENVLQAINQKYISLPDDEVKRNNKVLEEVLTQIITKMKEKNTLFKTMYSRVFYGGSYYDGLRVGNPEEFDLDLLLTLPKYAEPDLTNSNIPGFVHLQLKAMEKFEKQPEAHRHTGLSNLLDERHYLVTTKVTAWIEGIVTKALNEFDKSGNYTIFKTSSGKFKAKTHKGGPAFTLKLEGNVGGKDIKMDVDLVPCFVFTKEKWPPSPYRSNPVVEKPDFFIVPKRPGGPKDVQRYWRLSFQEQERVKINGYRTLKPSAKLLKKLRDMDNHATIASYFIKTIFLWEVDNKDKSLWDNSLSYVFMTMLKKYKDFIEQGKIPYYWNKNNNLIQNANSATVGNIANRLKAIIDDIEKHPSDPYVVAKYLVKADQFILMSPGSTQTTAGRNISDQMQQLRITPNTTTNPAITQNNVENSSRLQSDKIEKLKSEVVIGKKTLKQLQQLQISNGSNGMTSTTQNNAISSSTNNSSVKNSLQSNLQQGKATELLHQKSQSFTIQLNAASCILDEVNGSKTKLNSVTENAILSAINKLQETANNLTMHVTKLQNDNQKVFDFMKDLSGKIDEINFNIGELRNENHLLKNKLKAVSTEKKDSIDDDCFLTDTLTLTARHTSSINQIFL